VTKVWEPLRHAACFFPYMSEGQISTCPDGQSAYTKFVRGGELMDDGMNRSQRRSYRWPKQARDLVTQFLNAAREGGGKKSRSAQTTLITQLAKLTGYPRYACSRFLKQAQAPTPLQARPWTADEKQKLLDLISAEALPEVARQMHRSPSAIRTMLHRLGASAQMGKDWFTKHTLAKALRVRSEEVQRWIDQGWLKHRLVEVGEFTRQVIDSDALEEFCKKHRVGDIGRRIDPARLDFVQKYVFPPSHSDLLPVRESKKERAAFEQSHGDKLLARDGEHDREETLSA